jgi:hypothetical protein
MFCICMCKIELNFEEQIESKFEANSNRKMKHVMLPQLQPPVTSFLSETKILRSTHR